MKPSTPSRILQLAILCSLSFATADAQFWVHASGPCGGVIRCLETTQSGSFLAGVKGPGLYRSTDDGVTWSHAYLGDATVTALARKPGAKVILLGEQNGTYRSTDDGLTWTSLGGAAVPWEIVGFVYQSSTSSWYAATAWNGVYRSTDDGVAWSQADTGLTSTAMSSIGLDETGTTILAGTKGSGVFRSTDNGSNWIETNVGLTNLSTTDLLQAGGACLVSTTDGIYRTTSATWNWAKAVGSDEAYCLYADSVSNDLFAGSRSGFQRSTNGGANWATFGTGLPAVAYNVFALSGASNGTMVAALPGPGAYRSTDGGAHWARSTPGILALDVRGLVSDSSGTLYAGTEHGMFFRSTDRGDTWDSLLNVSSAVRNILVAGNRIFVGTNGDGVRVSLDGGSTFSPSLIPGLDGQLIFALARHSSTGAVFVGAQDGLHRTTNDGTTWESINAGLSDSRVSVLLMSSTGTLFRGNSYGKVFASTNEGTTWTEVDSGLGSTFIWCFAERQNTLYAGTNNGAFSSSDNGHSWQLTPLPNTALSLEVAANGDVYAGTYEGPYRSTDGGATWQRLADGFSGNSVRSFAVTPDGYVFAGTDGNGIYRSAQKVVNSVETRPDPVARAFALEQNYPNPFNPSTVIKYTVTGNGNRESGIGSGESRIGKTSLIVYDLLGRQVATLVDELKAPGTYEVQFSAIGRDGAGLATGVYIYRLTSGGYNVSRRMLLIK